MSTPSWPARLAPLLDGTQLPVEPRWLMPRQTDTSALQLLLLEASGRRLAIDILHVAEVAKVPRVTFVPRTPRFVVGVASIRGTLMPVVSLAQVLGLTSVQQADRPAHACSGRVVVLRGAAPVGLMVDRVLQVARPGHQALMPSSDDAAAQVPWAQGFAPLKDGLTAVLSVDALERLLQWTE